MATFTTRLGLRKPATSDAVNVTTDISDSMDTIDAAVGFESRTSFPGSPYTGKPIFRTDQSHQPYFYNGTEWLSIPHDFHSVIKSSDTTRNNTAAMANDPHLLLTGLKANTNYVIELFLIYNSVSAVPDLKTGWSAPAGAAITWTTIGLVPTATTPDDSIRLAANNIAGTKTLATIAGTDTVAIITGHLLMGGTTGTFAFQWAQNAATAENTVVKGFSYMTARRIR